MADRIDFFAAVTVIGLSMIIGAYGITIYKLSDLVRGPLRTTASIVVAARKEEAMKKEAFGKRVEN